MKFFGSLLICIAVVSCARPRPDRVVEPSPVPQPPTPPVRTTVAPPTEIRAVWVSNTDKLDWDSATRNLQRAGYNTMYINLASGGAAFYPSKFVPEVPGSVDPAHGIALAHQRGVQVHGKLIATFMFKTTPEFQKRLLATNRVMRGPTGKPIEQAGYYWLCPTQETNRTLLAGIVKEMLTRYPLDGLQFDYIRFCEQPSCYCSVCRREFERTLGKPVARWPQDVAEGALMPRFKSWQRQEITSLVRELSTLGRVTRPGLVVTSAVFSDLNRSRDEKAQDWKVWLDNRYLDYVCTMTYTLNMPEFETLVRKQQAWTGTSRRLVIGIANWKMTNPNQPREQINFTRQLGNYGFSLFSYDDAAERDFLPVVR